MSWHGTAEMFTATNGLFLRLLPACRAWAASSFPEPVSPWMKMFTSDGAY